MIPCRIKKGDTIGVVAPSNPIIEENIKQIKRAKEMVEQAGFKVKFSKHCFSNSLGYSSSAKEKAEDINTMFADQEVNMIWCAKGGRNSNSTFEDLDFEVMQRNPKIICGYSDITSLINIIYEKTGLVTFHSTNFKTIATDETNYSYQEVMELLQKGNLDLGASKEEFQTLQEGVAEGKLIGGNLNLISGLTAGKYKVDFQDKILFLEDLGIESDPTALSHYLYDMKQNGIFDKIKGLWIGNYEHESGISIEKVILDVLEDKYNFPIIKSNNFGHTEKKTVIPIGITAKINTEEEGKITLLEKCVR